MARRNSATRNDQGSLSFDADPFIPPQEGVVADPPVRPDNPPPVQPPVGRKGAPPASLATRPVSPTDASDHTVLDPTTIRATFGMSVREMLAPERLVRNPDPAAIFESANLQARRGFVSYREREVMVTECAGHWRMGYGMPAPLELLTGMGNMDLLQMSLDLLRRLLLDDPRWVFVTG